MGIGVFALICCALMAPIAIAGIRYDRPPVLEEKKIRYPYPEELTIKKAATRSGTSGKRQGKMDYPKY